MHLFKVFPSSVLACWSTSDIAGKVWASSCFLLVAKLRHTHETGLMHEAAEYAERSRSCCLPVRCDVNATRGTAQDVCSARKECEQSIRSSSFFALKVPNFSSYSSQHTLIACAACLNKLKARSRVMCAGACQTAHEDAMQCTCMCCILHSCDNFPVAQATKWHINEQLRLVCTPFFHAQSLKIL